MKKNYLLAVLFVFGMFTVNAQIDPFVDDMESYPVGDPIYEGHWTDWGCGGTCAAIASSAQAHGGSVSGYIPDDGAADAVLDYGNKIFGEWGTSFWLYVPSGKEGYMNLQGAVPIGASPQWIWDVFLNGDLATPGEGNFVDGNGGAAGGLETAFTFTHDVWFQVVMNFDLSGGAGAATYGMAINGQEVAPAGTPVNAFTSGSVPIAITGLGGIDFYSITTDNQLYIDDVVYQDSFISLGVNDLDAKGFVAFPNPVSSELNLKANESISSVAIFNILGQEVYNNASVDALNATIDMSSYASGAYFVKVNINGTEGIVKIVK